MNLNGTWEFEYDDSNLGLDQNWATPAFPRIPLGKSGLHAANVMPIWLLASTVWKRPLPAFFTAAIFAVHPVVRIGYQYCGGPG